MSSGQTPDPMAALLNKQDRLAGDQAEDDRVGE
jgi:hypothetical protein